MARTLQLILRKYNQAERLFDQAQKDIDSFRYAEAVLKCEQALNHIYGAVRASHPKFGIYFDELVDQIKSFADRNFLKEDNEFIQSRKHNWYWTREPHQIAHEKVKNEYGKRQKRSNLEFLVKSPHKICKVDSDSDLTEPMSLANTESFTLKK